MSENQPKPKQNNLPFAQWEGVLSTFAGQPRRPWRPNPPQNSREDEYYNQLAQQQGRTQTYQART